MTYTIRPMTDKEYKEFELLAAVEGQREDEAVRQSHDRDLMLTELSEYDLSHMREIIKEGHGDWFQARLLRALDGLLIYADGGNLHKLRTAFPGTCAAYIAWYNGSIPSKEVPVAELIPVCEHSIDEMSTHYSVKCDESGCEHYCEPCITRIYPNG